jgi:hypothetical protein
MAIFASTTLGSSDPSRALSIKALEARAQALAQAQSKQELPTSLPSPWQGVSLVANQAADAFAAKRADQAAAARRQELAGVMSGIGPEGPNPGQLAQITGADPEIGKLYAQQAFTARQNAADIQARREMAAEKAKQDEAAAVSAEQRLGARPQTDVGKVKQDLAAGRLSQEEADAALKKLTAPGAGEQNIINKQNEQAIEAQSGLSTLDEALGLLNSKEGIHSGIGAGVKTDYGRYIPESMGGPNEARTNNTLRYNEIMNSEALNRLTQMKGASSDRDVQINFKIVNDPTAPIENKRRALSVLRDKLAAHLKANEGAITAAGGTPTRLEKTTPAAPAAAAAAAPAAGGDLLEQARKAIAAGAPRDKVIERLRQKGMDATGL